MATIDHSSTRTFTQKARRAQIVQATIETVAELGYSRTSFRTIAQHAGLSSTGMISYHFAGKPELLSEVVKTIMQTAEKVARTRMSQERTHRGKLCAYIQANFDFIAEYPAHTQTLAELIALIRYRRVAGLDGIERTVLSVDRLVDLLEQGRSTGEFGTFDSFTMALAIRGTIDTLLRHHLLDTGLDLDRCAQELTDLFDRCTQPA